MRLRDRIDFAWRALAGYRTRTLLMTLAMAIGVAAVVVLTALGEGARGYVRGQFASLGTNLVVVLPGRAETTGSAPGMLLGETPRDLTIADASALLQSRAVRRVAPLNIGEAEVSWESRSRSVPVLGSTSSMLAVRHMKLGAGRFLPEGDPEDAPPVCVIGDRVRAELFGARRALGQWVRIGDRRFRVIGVLARQGMSLGFDSDELVIVPVAAAQALFDSPSLFRILVEARGRDDVAAARADIRAILSQRHEGEEDVTVLTQDAVLATFDRILRALTLAVAGIAAISLGVAGILIMNVMLIAVSQRRAEIGLLKALGSPPGQIRQLFFAEAALLSGFGAGAGLALGQAGSMLVSALYPQLPPGAPAWAIGAALAVALAVGISFSVLPARSAARLDPVQALSRR